MIKTAFIHGVINSMVKVAMIPQPQDQQAVAQMAGQELGPQQGMPMDPAMMQQEQMMQQQQMMGQDPSMMQEQMPQEQMAMAPQGQEGQAAPEELQKVQDSGITPKDIESAAKVVQVIAEMKAQADMGGMEAAAPETQAPAQAQGGMAKQAAARGEREESVIPPIVGAGLGGLTGWAHGKGTRVGGRGGAVIGGLLGAAAGKLAAPGLSRTQEEREEDMAMFLRKSRGTTKTASDSTQVFPGGPGGLINPGSPEYANAKRKEALESKDAGLMARRAKLKENFFKKAQK